VIHIVLVNNIRRGRPAAAAGGGNHLHISNRSATMSNTNMISRSSIKLVDPVDPDSDQQNYRPTTDSNCVAASVGVVLREDFPNGGGGPDGTKNHKVAIRPRTVNFTTVVDPASILNTPSLITSCAITVGYLPN